MAAAIRVLYVDDEPDLLELGKLFLEQTGQFSVETITSAPSALALLNAKTFDAIISDYQMPDMDGIEFLKRVRTSGNTLPFILFTGKGREEVVIEAINSGVDFYLQKGGDPTAQFAELSNKIWYAITRRKAEDGLKKSERDYRNLVENSQSIIYALHPNGTFTFVSPSWKKHLGHEPAEVLGHNFRAFIHPDDIAMGEAFLEKTIAAGAMQVTKNDYRIFHKDGSIHWHRSSIMPLMDEKGNLVSIVGNAVDLTERKEAEEELKRREEQSRNLLSTMPDIVIVHQDGIIVYANQTAVDKTGFSQEELLGSHLFNYVVPEDRERAVRNMAQRISGDVVGDYEIDVVAKSGALRHVIVRSSPIVFNQKPSVVVILVDITERNKAEMALRESENLYRTIFETTGAATILIGNDTTILKANLRFSSLSGFSIEELEGKKSWTEFVVPEDLERMKQYHRDRREDPSHEVVVYEFRYLNRYGEIRQCINNVRVIPGTTLSVASVVDISERKQAEEELRKREENYRSILENIQDVYYRSDVKGNLILASPSLATLLGYASVSELYEKSIAQTLYKNPQERENVLAAIQKNGSVTNYEVTFKKQDGTPVITSTSSHEYYDADGNLLGIEGIFRDITDRKRVEESLKRSENLYRTIFEITGAASIIIEEDTTIVLANSGFAEISGFSIEELEGKKNWTEFVVPEDLERMKKYHVERRNEPPFAPRVYEFRFITRSGEIRHCIVHVGMIPGTTQSVASVVDISERVKIEETLKDSENLYRTIFNNTGAATIIIAPDTTILLANDGWVDLTGTPREEQENKKSWTVFIDQADVERMKQYHYARRIDPTLVPKIYECKVIDATKTVHHCFVHVDLIPGSKNSVASLVDITSRVQAEELYQTVFENTGTAMIIIEEDMTISHINEEMENIWGYSKEEVEGRMKWPQLVVEEDLPKMLEYHRLRRADSKSAPKYYEFRCIHKDGGLRDASLTIAMIPGAKKSVISLIDITDQKKAEESLRESEEQFRLIFDSANDAIVLLENGCFTRCNRKTLELFGCSEESEIIGHSVAEFSPEFQPDGSRSSGQLVANNEQALKGSPLVFEWVHIQRDGIPFTAEVSLSRLDTGGKMVIQSIIRDISDWKQADAATKLARKKLDMMNEVTRHEIRNLITGIIGSLDMAYSMPSGGAREMLNREIKNLILKIQREIDFTEEYQEIGIHLPGWHQVQQLIPSSGNLQIRISPEIASLEVYADPLLARIFVYLTENVTRHGAHATEITLSAYENPRSIVIIFEDNGIGVPDEMKEVIFTRREGDRKGMGLFLVREILAITGILINETGTPGKGARFEIVVPKGTYRYTVNHISNE